MASIVRLAALRSLSRRPPVHHPLSHRIRLVHQSPITPPRLCPSCSQPLPLPLPACTNCWHISRIPPDTKFHDIFGLSYNPNPFIVDVATLKQRFRDAQTICHPDSWASKGPNKQQVAQALSAHINEAYQCLLKPLSRAEYILECHHLPVSETDQVDDMEFMSDIMQVRETIEDAADQDAVEALMGENRDMIQDTISALEAFVGTQQWESVKAAAVRLRYLEGIERAAKKWMDNH